MNFMSTRKATLILVGSENVRVGGSIEAEAALCSKLIIDVSDNRC